jgi:hypothetical protein
MQRPFAFQDIVLCTFVSAKFDLKEFRDIIEWYIFYLIYFVACLSSGDMLNGPTSSSYLENDVL